MPSGDIPQQPAVPEGADIVYQEYLRLIQGEKAKRIEAVSHATRATANAALEPDIPPERVVDECMHLYLSDSRLSIPQEGFHTPASLRDWVNAVMDAGIEKAIGAIAVRSFELHNRNPEKTKHILEQCKDLIRLLYAWRRDTSMVRRVRALLRYLFDSHYHQDESTIRALCEQSEYDAYRVDDQGNQQLVEGGKQNWKLELLPNQFFVDIACGRAHTVKFAERFVGAGNALGLDFNPENAFENWNEIKLALVDCDQVKMANGSLQAKHLSFSNIFGRADFAFSALVDDRVSHQIQYFLNRAAITKPGGILCIAVLLPVCAVDDAPTLSTTQRIRYGDMEHSVTEGRDSMSDLAFIHCNLHQHGYENEILVRPLERKDPETGRSYNNYFLIVAQKKGGEQPRIFAAR